MIKTFTETYKGDFEDFYKSYVECAFWCEEENIDNNLEISQQTYDEMKQDCEAFLNENYHLIENSGNYGQAGHDFWLSRNGHGTGFWDREEIYGEISANALHKAAKKFSESYCLDEYYKDID